MPARGTSTPSGGSSGFAEWSASGGPRGVQPAVDIDRGWSRPILGVSDKPQGKASNRPRGTPHTGGVRRRA
ncbi:hypothetical protein FTUN_2139 [Frigoriglobus tundricola]|uniref:Uncharacterized protein n=1 Tax=Frigoriglobus tundricola TaxID=2774151 RepID=A0A6M5YKR3_9BACT|nr:hypothetical protein FTUN_2139 [Frigoriglobus tundricola]